MKEYNFDINNQKVYYKKLNNGLDVYLLPRKAAQTFYMTFTTKYGSKYKEFIPFGENEYLNTPFGVAHFLEHKMFEQEDGTDPFEYFSSLGIGANAYTTLDNTTYLAYGSTNFSNALNYLIDYVQSPYFTDENVLKEQGIIGQEITMYLDDPDSVLEEKIRYNAFLNNPIKESIIGSKEDIASITKETLYSCYNTFYHPHNMFIVISGNFDKDEALKVIEENQSKKDYNNENDTVYKIEDEPNEVVKKEEVIPMLVATPKVSLGIKIPVEKFKTMDKKTRNLYVDFVFNLMFDNTSKIYEELSNENIIISDINVSYIDATTHLFVTITSTSNEPDIFLKRVKEELNNITISNDDIKRRINSYVSGFIYSFEDIRNINWIIESNIKNYNKVYTNLKQIYTSINKKEIDKFITKLDLSNTNSVIITKKD